MKRKGTVVTSHSSGVLPVVLSSVFQNYHEIACVQRCISLCITRELN